MQENGVLQARCQERVQLSLEEAGCCLCNLREHIMVEIGLNKKLEEIHLGSAVVLTPQPFKHKLYNGSLVAESTQSN